MDSPVQQEPASSEPISQVSSTTPVVPVQSSSSNNSERLPGRMIIVILLLLPPLAWYLIWKDKRYTWYSYLLWLYALLSLSLLAIFFLLVAPELKMLFKDIGVEAQKTQLVLFLHYFFIVLSVAEILFGIMLRMKLKTKGVMSKSLFAVTLLFFLFNSLLPFFSYSVIMSIGEKKAQEYQQKKKTHNTSSISPTIDQTATWKTYTSSKYGVSFQYSGDWVESSEQGIEVLLKIPNKVGAGGLNGLSVEVKKNPRQLPLDKWIQENNYGDGYDLEKVLVLFPYKWVIDRNAPGAGFGQSVLIAKDDKIVELYCGGCSDETINHILSSLRFAEQEDL